jgi:transposase-like protein
VTDPFATLRKLASERDKLNYEFWSEISALRAAGYSLRAIAEVAHVSHNSVFRRVG